MNPKKVVRKVVPKTVVSSLETTYRKSRGQFWQARYAWPAKGMKVIAITGTNGKTTTASYINSLLKAGGFKTAVYTTAYYEINGEVTPNRSHMTVTSQKSIQSFFSQAKKAKVDWIVLEVTSHALDQGRIAGVTVDVAVLTNLTQDHLDYHGTMENYALAKSRLFGKEYLAKFAVLNSDDQWYEFFAVRSTGQVVSYGKNEHATVRLLKTSSSQDGSVFTVDFHKQKYELTTGLLGTFNIYNAMAAYGVGKCVGISEKDIAKGIAGLDAVAGRMEEIDEGQNFKVLVDFAYTPDALLNALTTLRPLTRGKLRIVFGATGDRDAGKRPQMGEVVAKHADAIYLTDDETYTEDPQTIRDAVYEGIKTGKGTSKTKVFDDRLEAIKQAFKDAKKGDTVLLAGIGHENYRNMGGKKLPWDEREIARKLLEQK